jgi:hypothetical protein
MSITTECCTSIVISILVTRHLRFLLRSADEAINKLPTLASLQTEVTVTKTVVSSIQAELADTKRQRELDHAKSEEEKDGRLNEKYVSLTYFWVYFLFYIS